MKVLWYIGVVFTAKVRQIMAIFNMYKKVKKFSDGLIYVITMLLTPVITVLGIVDGIFGVVCFLLCKERSEIIDLLKKAN